MTAPQRNQFWKARSKHGRNKSYADPETLWRACCEYFDWVEANPLREVRVFHAAGVLTEASIPRMRAMTIGGLSLYLGINKATWFRWREDEDFCDVVARVEEIIREQKFAGAAANLLNANIIARDLGLRDAKEVTGSEGGPIQMADLSDEQIRARIRVLLSRLDYSQLVT